MKGETDPMFTNRAMSVAGLLALAFASIMFSAALAKADEGDPPSRAARLAFVEGSVSFHPGGTDEWVAAPLNRPLTTGDQLWSDRDGRVELQLDGSLLRLSSSTAVSFLNLSDNVTQIQLSSGTLLVRVRRLEDNETYEIDTPNLAFTVLRPGLYRLSVDEAGNTTAIRVRDGQGEVTGAGSAYPVNANEYDEFSGTNELVENTQPYRPDDPFDAWSASRDARWERSASARYVSPDVVGYEDLDDQGTWGSTPDYGYVWFPRGVENGWAPYHYGHWSYVPPWGYTWVDDQPWGFAPFHYGRWIFVRGAWGWVPAPPRVEGMVYVRPVYAPALVAWVGAGATIAWFALGPREVFVPSYPVSRAYVNNINVSNTTVNTTVINNVYNTTIINNKTVNVTNVTYVNRSVPGAVTATTSQAFTTAQPVSRNLVQVDQRAIASAPVHALAPAEAPTKQAVLGAARVVTVKPPAAVQTRAVVARTTPPAPPLPFEKRQEAIKSNGGRPLSAAEVRSIQSNTAPRAAAVRIAPPATPVAARPTPKPAMPGSPAPRAQPVPTHPPVTSTEVTRAAPAPIHPNELPPPVKPVSPGVANSALERQHLQEQQQLQARQEEERRQVQQQQELEHAQLAKQQADEARKQQLEQQHQQQTQQLMGQHAREQQQLQEKQEEQRRQQEAQAQAQAKKQKNEHSANPKP